MAQKMGKGKRKRAHKVSKGTGRGAKPIQLDPVQLVLLGKGAYRSFSPIGSIKHG